MTSDGELLRCYTESNSEDAFSELVARNVDLVYSTALRLVGGATHLANDALFYAIKADFRTASPFNSIFLFGFGFSGTLLLS